MKTSEQWRGAVEGLRHELAIAEQSIAAIDADRAPDVLVARLGDEDAQARLVKHDEQRAAAERDVSDLTIALTQAAQMLEAAETREAEERRQHDMAEAELLEGEAYRLATQVDADLDRVVKRVECIQERLQRAGRMRGTRNSHNVATRVQFAVRAAYWHAGLKVGDHVRNAHQAPLVESLAGLLGTKITDQEEAA